MRGDREPLAPQRLVGGDADTRREGTSTAGTELPPTPRATFASLLARTLQVAFLIHLRQLPQTLLQLLPGSYSSPRRFLRPFRHVVARGLPLLSAIADIEVRTMLGSALVAMAAQLSTRAVGFRQGSENRHPGQTRDLAQQLPPSGGSSRLQHARSSCALFLRSCQRASENRFLVITDQPT